MARDERLMILQMVADKKITAAEATELLRALEAPEAQQPGGAHSAEQRAEGTQGADASARTSSLGSGLGAFIEDVVERVTSVFSDVVGPSHEIPAEVTGEFTGDEIPLRVVTGNGHVEVGTWDQPGYRAKIVVKSRGSSEAEARNRACDAYILKADGAGFDLEARRSEFGDLAVHVTLLVPLGKTYRLEVRTGNGHVALDDLHLGEGRVSTGNGRITVRGVRGEQLALRSGNGSIEIEGDLSSLEAGTGNGAITLTPTGQRAQAYKLGTGNGSIRTDSGRLGSNTALRVDAHTGMGNVNLECGQLVYEREIRSYAHKHVIAHSPNLDQADAVVTITARTGMGSITLA